MSAVRNVTTPRIEQLELKTASVTFTSERRPLSGSDMHQPLPTFSRRRGDAHSALDVPFSDDLGFLPHLKDM